MFGIYQRAKFAVPENPVSRALATGTANVGAGCSGLGCPNGMGDLNNLQSNLTSLNLGAVLSGDDFMSGIPNWAIIAGGLFAFSLFSRSADYRSEQRKLREKYPRGYKRAYKAGRAAYKAAAAA